MDVSWEVKRFVECSADDVFEFAKLRTDVFFLEQHCDEEELDAFDRDPETIHLFARVNGEMVGYARVVFRSEPDPLDEGITTSIGRVVVAASARGHGIAQGLMQQALSLVPTRDVVVHAQSYVAGLYASCGFDTFGEPFVEAGIPHLRMKRIAEKTV